MVPGPVRHRPRAVGALAVHGQVDQAGQLAGQVGHVHPGTAIHLRRVLAGQQGDAQPGSRPGCGHLTTSWPLPTTASLITAFRPITVLCRITERSTVDQLLTRTPGDSTDSRTVPPDTMTPLLTRLASARPTRSPE